jgi:predicted nucleic acid-binding protein
MRAAIFGIELRNVLLKAIRRQLLSVDVATRAIHTLSNVVATATRELDLDALFALAHAEALSLFDAAYLDLGLALGGELASRDSALIAACARRGLIVRDLR